MGFLLRKFGLVLIVLLTGTNICLAATPFARVEPVNTVYSASPGESVEFFCRVTNTCSQDSDIYLQDYWGLVLLLDGSPNVTQIDSSYILHPDDTVIHADWLLEVPADAAVGSSYRYSVCESAAIYKDGGTSVWSASKNDWVALEDFEFPTNIGQFTVQINVVPEPSSVLALLCGTSGVGCIAWKRRSA